MTDQVIIRVFDNGGKTWDRYTVVIYQDGDVSVYGMSSNADAPNGFNQFAGSLAENGLVLDAINGIKTDLGREVQLMDLPGAVKKSIAGRL